MMHDDSRPMTHDERDAAICAAKKEGGMCAACGRALSADEPVWRRRMASRLGWGSHFRPTSRRALVGRECAAPETLEASEGREPAACAGCGRGMHYPVARSRRATVCSTRCRLTVQRRRSKGGQPS